MKNNTNFSRQSSKGIIVIYAKLLLSFFKSSWILFFFIFKDFYKLSSVKLLYIFIGISVVLLVLLVRAYLLYKNFLFRVRDDKFELKQGILKKTNTSIDFDRIQNVSLSQNLIQQFIGVYQVEIETAGSEKTEISIKALKIKDANALKKKLSKYKEIASSAVFKKEKPFLKITLKELVKVGLAENHLISLLLLSSILFGVFNQVKDIFKGFGFESFFKKYFNEGFDFIIHNLILLLIVAVISIFTSVIRVFLFHFNLTVFFKNKAFEINQGLFTKRFKLLKLEKIQSITISDNIIKKKLGISSVVFKQAGESMLKKNKKLIKIVGCKKELLVKIKEILYAFENVSFSEKRCSDIFFKKRLFLWSFVLLVALNLVLFFSFKDLNSLFVNILLIPLLILNVITKFKKRFYKISDDLLIVSQGGIIETHHTYLPFYKVQNIKMKQSVFQKRSNVVDLIFQTALGKVDIPCLQKSEAVKIYNYTLFKVESNTKPWM